jgi:hypothetical protein
MSPPPAPPPPPQQGSQAGRVGWRGLNNNYLAAVLSPILDQHGPVLSEMARPPTASQPSPDKISSLYTSVVSTPAFGCIVFRHQAGSHEVLISCCLCAPPSDACAPADVRRRRHRRNRAPAAAATSEPPPVHGAPRPTAPSQSSPTPPDVPSPATIVSPPAKRTRKAARRRCEAELLRDSDAEDELQLSPIS